MDELERLYEENIRSVALDFVTNNYRDRVTEGRKRIQECLQRIGQEIVLVSEEEKKLLDWYKQKTGSDDARSKLRQLTSELRAPPWRSAQYDLSIPLVIKRGAAASSSHNADGSSKDIPTLESLPHDTPGPASGVGPSAMIENQSASLVTPRAANNIPAVSANKSDGRQHSHGDTPVGSSRKRKAPREDLTDTPDALESLESRPFVEPTDVFGRSFAFEYPKDTGNICIVKCQECDWLCKLNPVLTIAPVENHWLISKRHRDLNYKENRRQIRIREILERHTYRIAGATRQWATESNHRLMKDRNAARHAEGSQAPKAPPQSASTTQSSAHRPASPRDTSYRGNLRGDMASEKYELRPRTNQGPEESTSYELRPRANRGRAGSRSGDRSSSSSLSFLCSDSEEEAGVLRALEADVPDQGNVGEAMPDEVMPDEVMPDEVMPDEAMPDEAMPDKNMPDEFISDEVQYIRTVVRQLEDMPAAADFEEKTFGDIKTEPGLDP